MTESIEHRSAQGANFLPDFCSGQTLLPLLFFLEMIVILLTLASASVGPDVWEKFLLLSIYLQWIGLSGAVALCMIRRWTEQRSSLQAAGLAYLSLLVVTTILAEAAYHTVHRFGLDEKIQMQEAEFLMRNLGVCAIAGALALRYFWVQKQWREEVLRQGEVRYALLQARIRPHFLFNSLNSIAALTAISPAAAEESIVDLSALLRANLEKSGKEVPLSQEITLTKAYLRIEQHRLGSRLEVLWLVKAEDHIHIPSLSLQPLVENAIRHGIEPIPSGGLLTIEIVSDEQNNLRITLRNPLQEASSKTSKGFGEALRNIKERLQLKYGDKASLITEQHESTFIVRLYLPSSSHAYSSGR